MKILIFCALQEEARPILRMIRSLPLETCFCRLTITGPGRKNVQRAWANRDKDFPPDLVIFCGFAGGLDPRLDSGKLVLADQILLWEASSKEPLVFATDGLWFKKVRETLSRWGSDVYCGKILTSSRVVSKRNEKRELGGRFGALAVDMESGYLAQLLSPDSIPFMVLRAISDTAEESLRIDFSPWIDRTGAIQRTALLLSQVKSPQNLLYLFRMGRTTRRAGKRLAEVLREIILALR